MTPLHRNAAEWEDNARRNAMWAILTDRDRTDRAWDADDFFATGEREVDAVIGHLEKIGQMPDVNGSVLDFGCGVGRVTRALMQRFPRGFGIDVSTTMIDLARRYSAEDPVQAVYLVNQSDGLPSVQSASIDFLYSHIVLQHLPATLQPVFIAEFLRVLAPGGLAAFQLPTEDLTGSSRRLWGQVKANVRSRLPRSTVGRIRRALGKGEEEAGVTMDMTVFGAERVAAIADTAGCAIVAAPYTNSTDTSHRGALRFMTREQAIADITAGRTDSRLLSQFFFVRRPAER